MKNKGKAPSRRRQGEDGDANLARKRRSAAKQAQDGRANGMLRILGPIDAQFELVIRADARGALARETRRDPEAKILRFEREEEDLIIETESEKLAQHIADTLRRSRQMEVDRTFVDAASCRVLVCRPPEREE